MSKQHHNHHHGRFLFGTFRDDTLTGTNRDDKIFGLFGDDTIFGRGGNDAVHGGHGDDLIDGGSGNDNLFGDHGNDGLAGGSGKDNLAGGWGRDFLVSGAGKDNLDGGAGNDKYVIRDGTGTDTVKKLQAGDRVDLSDFGFASAADVIDAFQQVGRNAVLDLGGGDKLILENTRVSRLEEDQFIVSDAETGPSSSQSPYVVGVHASISTEALLTVGDETSDGTGWQMVGIPDGLGAFDNHDGTFTVLMNHELPENAGVVRDHGFAGSFVSKLIIDKTTLEVLSGEDLIQQGFTYNPATGDYDPLTAPIGRLCSADLADKTAYFNPATGLGYNGGRIFLSGEEVGNEGRAFAHFATGSEAGNSYELAWLGNMSYENQVANPHTGDKTVVALTDDSTPGQVYFYVGDKKAAAPGRDALDMAGLTGGSFYGLKVSELDNAADNNNESNGTTLGADGQSAFSLVNLGDVSAKTGADIQADSEADEVTEFLRPEDGQWGTVDPDIFYFVTTNGFGSPSRLWAAAFNDASDPTAGGTIKLLLDGTEGQQMLDNMTVNEDGKIIMQEDPGNNAHLAKVWEYDPETDELTQLAQHDPDRFITGAPNFITQDEESSGVIDVTDILGSAGQNVYLMDVQSHNSLGGELVQGGQLLLMYQDLI